MTSIPPGIANLGLHHRESLRAQFKTDVAAGTARPLVLPLDLLGSYFLPVLFLCIPHTRRPWLYRLRFAVMGLIVWLNLDMMSRASSLNMAAAYGTGLLGSYGILWAMTLLVWTRPQFEAERVERRVRKRGRENGSNGVPAGGNGHVGGGLVPRRANGVVQLKQKEEIPLAAQSAAPDETVAHALEDGYEYYWQAYPADASLWTRLDWVADHIGAFRGSGWNTAISSIPSFCRPSKPQSGELVDLASIPMSTKPGFARATTYRSFIQNRVWHTVWGYLVLDMCSVVMMKDPYFVLGPDYPSHLLPSYLAALPGPLLDIVRSTIALAGIVSALFMVFCLAQVAQFLAGYYSPSLRRSMGARADIWQYPSIFGDFESNVLDFGLAGFWGGWWHQTFRATFVAPTAWMVRKGVLPSEKGHPLTRAVGVLVAFVQSGMLHAAGSWTSLSTTATPWSPPLFFLASWVGVLIQAGWEAAFGEHVRRCPLWVRRGTNLVFVAAWLHFTRPFFVDDVCRTALWLFEPVPISPLRAMGLGKPGDSWWRWDWDIYPYLYVGKHWWESGIAI